MDSLRESYGQLGRVRESYGLLGRVMEGYAEFKRVDRVRHRFTENRKE